MYVTMIRRLVTAAAAARCTSAAATEALQVAVQQDIPSKVKGYYHFRNSPSQAAATIARLLCDPWLGSAAEVAAAAKGLRGPAHHLYAADGCECGKGPAAAAAAAGWLLKCSDSQRSF